MVSDTNHKLDIAFFKLVSIYVFRIFIFIKYFCLQANDSADPERLEHVEKQLLSLQEELDSANAEKAQILQEKSDLLAKCDDPMEVDSLKVQLEETSKVI